MTQARPPRRRWFQYSIRSILVVMTVLAAWLAVQVNRARHQQRAIAAIKQMRGGVIYEHEFRGITRVGTGAAVIAPPGPRWLRKLIGDDYFFRVWQVQLSSGNDTLLKHVSRLHGLRNLRCLDGDFTEDGIAALRRLHSLEILAFGRAAVSDAALDHVGCIKSLQQLTFNGASVTDAGFGHLAGLNGIHTLRLRRSPVTDDGIRHLSGLPGMTILDLTDTKVTKGGEEELKKRYPRIGIGR